MVGEGRENTSHESDNPQIPPAFDFDPEEGSELNTPVLGTEVVESLCLEMPKSCLDMVFTGDSWWPCLGECLAQVISKVPSNLSHSVTLEKQLHAALSHCPSLLQGQGENGTPERKWGWPTVFIGTQLLSSAREEF